MNTSTLTVDVHPGEQAPALVIHRLLQVAGFRPAGLPAYGGMYTRVHSRHANIIGVPHPAREKRMHAPHHPNQTLFGTLMGGRHAIHSEEGMPFDVCTPPSCLANTKYKISTVRMPSVRWARLSSFLGGTPL